MLFLTASWGAIMIAFAPNGLLKDWKEALAERG